MNRARNLYILSVCSIYRLIRGKADAKALTPPKAALFFHSGKLGDMVCATPLFRSVKKAYPSCRVVVFGDKINREVVAGNGDIDEYVVFEKDAVWGNTRRVKGYKADYACVLTPSIANLASLFLAGIPLIAAPKVENGRSPYETRSYVALLSFVMAVPHRMGSYAPREYLRLLEPIGIKSEDTTKRLAFSAAAAASVESLFRDRGIQAGGLLVGISVTVGNKIKRWPAERFTRLIDCILSDYPKAKVVLIGSARDTEETKLVLDGVSREYVPRVSDLSGLCGIEELKALIARLSVFISVDTGPIYIAEAFDIPTVDIIGPIDENEQPPRGPKHKNVIAERAGPELYVLNAREYDRAEARRQVEAISVDEVMKAFKELFPV